MATEIQLPQCWVDVRDALEAGIKRLGLFGPPGTGKTKAGLTMGVPNSKKARRLVCNQEMTTADITGHFMPTANGTWQWHDGSVIQAWREGARLVADELNEASGDVQAQLLAMFDSHESASWCSPDTGEIITPQDGFSVVFTTNVEDMRDLPTALVDRFPVVIRINTPHPDALSFLSEDLRVPAALSADAPADRRISMRGWMAFDELRSNLIMRYGQEEAQNRAAALVFRDLAESVLDSLSVNAVS